jgi:hypothetical protein
MAGNKQSQEPDMRVLTTKEYNALLVKALGFDPKKLKTKDNIPLKKSRK